MSVREATHAGSWYSSSGPTLSAQLDDLLANVPDELPGIGKTPVPGARVVIAPHAGYAYSGPCAAWAYRSLDLSKAKRIFILHPSHHVSLSTLALPTLSAYSTPLSPSPLPLDLPTIQHLSTLSATINSRTLKFTTMTKPTDEAEHSAEMQLPYLHRLLQLQHPNLPPSQYPPLIPIMVGSTTATTETAFGQLLAPYIANPENAFIISTDFCHWGSRFGHTYYIPSAPHHPASSSSSSSPRSLPNGVVTASAGSDEAAAAAAAAMLDLHTDPDLARGRHLSPRDRPARTEAAIHESISHVDRACMCAIASGEHAAFLDVLRRTGNTVCGRHPIGVFMAGWEEVERRRKEEEEEGGGGGGGGGGEGGLGVEEGMEKGGKKGRFRFVRYERSSDAIKGGDSSVSYVSAFAVL